MMQVVKIKMLPHFFKQRIRRFILMKKYDVSIGLSADVTLGTQFEGRNHIGESSLVSGAWIGLGSYISKNSEISRSRIGRFCSIGQNVRLGMGLHPTQGFVSTHPAFFARRNSAGFSFVDADSFESHKYISCESTVERYEVIVGNDVWLGNNVKVMDGVRIGDGAVVGLGSIVTKDIEPYSINVGSPAKKKGYRFNEDQRKFLLDFKWWNRDIEWIEKQAYLFSDIEKFIKSLKQVDECGTRTIW